MAKKSEIIRKVSSINIHDAEWGFGVTVLEKGNISC